MSEKQIRALAGLSYAAFEVLFGGKLNDEYTTEDINKVFELVGALTRYLMQYAGIEITELTGSQCTRLMEEAVTYMTENPL